MTLIPAAEVRVRDYVSIKDGFYFNGEVLMTHTAPSGALVITFTDRKQKRVAPDALVELVERPEPREPEPRFRRWGR